MDINTWTTRHAVKLRAAYRAVHPEVSDERFAQALVGMAPRTLYNWQNTPEKPLRPAMQRLVKDFYATTTPKVRDAFRRLLEAPTGIATSQGLIYAPSLADSLSVLAALGHDGTGLTASLDALTQAALDWLVVPTRAEASDVGRPVDAATVAEIRRTTAALDTLERTIGGDHCRATAVEFLRNQVAPRLRSGADGPVRRDLFSAAAALCELIGWMAYDVDQHGLAQRYFVQGLRLAREAGDTAYGAYILSTMSHQALYLQSPAHALRLARLAADQAARVTNPTVQTEALVLVARAHAALDDRSAGPAALREAELAFGRPTPDALPEWSHAWNDVLFASHAGTTWVELGHAEEAEEAFRLVWETARGQPRRQVYSGVHLARAALIRRDLDSAIGYARDVLPGIESTSSRRSRAEVRTLLTELGEYSSVAGVRDLGDQIRLAIGDTPTTA